ncbi:hypothetical protein [Phenylobacterium sp.]|jgi:hypothetical protein|uniref:hypothetical protein n=1 Tax=Phenylobacterium sp. TaxID=1871053 RepID=UPI002F3E2AF8
MRTRASILAAAVLASVGAAEAQSKTDVTSLKAFQGRWDCTGAFASGKPTASDITATWDAPSQSLILHQDDKPPGPFHAIELWGAGEGVGFRAAISDPFSGERWLESPGWADDKLTWTRYEGVKPMERFIYSRPNARGFFVEWFPIDKTGAFVLGDRLACKAVA